MTWLKKTWNKFSKWTSKTFGSLWNKVTGNDLTPAEQKTMDFNAQQAELNRQFQSAEADEARQWQEDYYLKYESPQARIRQYEDAGLNPALLYGSNLGSGSPPSTSVPSGSVASVGFPSDGTGLLDFIGQMLSIKSQISLNKAKATQAMSDANKADAEASESKQRQDWNPKLWQSQLDTGVVSRDNLRAGIEKLKSDINLNASKVQLTDAQIKETLASVDNTVVDTAKKQLEIDGVRVNNELLAAKVIEVQTQSMLNQALTALNKSNTESVNIANFVSELDKETAAKFHGSMPKNIYDLVPKLANGMSIELRNLWDTITGRFKSNKN